MVQRKMNYIFHKKALIVQVILIKLLNKFTIKNITTFKPLNVLITINEIEFYRKQEVLAPPCGEEEQSLYFSNLCSWFTSLIFIFSLSSALYFLSGDMAPGQKVAVKLSFSPQRTGVRRLLVDFDSDRLKDVKGYATVVVRKKYSPLIMALSWSPGHSPRLPKGRSRKLEGEADLQSRFTEDGFIKSDSTRPESIMWSVGIKTKDEAVGAFFPPINVTFINHVCHVHHVYTVISIKYFFFLSKHYFYNSAWAELNIMFRPNNVQMPSCRRVMMKSRIMDSSVEPGARDEDPSPIKWCTWEKVSEKFS